MMMINIRSSKTCYCCCCWWWWWWQTHGNL